MLLKIEYTTFSPFKVITLLLKFRNFKNTQKQQKEEKSHMVPSLRWSPLIFSMHYVLYFKKSTSILKHVSFKSSDSNEQDSIHTVSTLNCYEDPGQLAPCHPKWWASQAAVYRTAAWSRRQCNVHETRPSPLFAPQSGSRTNAPEIEKSLCRYSR